MKKILTWLAKSWPLLILLLFSLWIRLYLYQRMHPVVHTDSVTYFFLGETDSVRTPGYPVFVEILLSVNDLFSFSNDYIRVICFGQLFILGLLNVWFMYRLTHLLARSRMFALAMGLLYSGNFLVVGFEIQVMTETLSITLFLATLNLYLKLFKAKKSIAMIAGLLAVWLIYTRPSFLFLWIFLPFLTFLGYLPHSKKIKFRKKILPVMTVFVLTVTVGICSWSLLSQSKTGSFGFSGLTALGLSYYTGPYFEKYRPSGDPVQDRVAEVYSEETKRASYSLRIFYLHKRLKNEMKLSDAEISSAFLKVNLKLIKDYPLEYLKQIPDSIIQYYQTYSPYWTSGNARIFLRKNNFFGVLFRKLFNFYKKMFTKPLLLFVLLLLSPLVVLLADCRKKKSFHGWLILEGVIHYTCFVSVLLTKAGINNMRYRAPAEPLIILIFFSALFYCGRGSKKLLTDVYAKLKRGTVS